jgi:hypothetical protein
MGESFTLPFSGDKDAKLRQVRALAAQEGFKFEGDTRTGVFSGDTSLGKVSGTYSISGDMITITERGLVPVALIKSKIAEFLR